MATVTTELAPTEVLHAADGVVVSGHVLKEVGARILDRFDAYFPGEQLIPARASVSIGRLREASSYPLFVALIDPGSGEAPHEIIVKFAPVFPENNEGRTEHMHLSAMFDRLGPASRIRVPRPLDFFDDVNVLLVERVGGERFSRVILRDASRFAGRDAAARLREASHLCGCWLSEYHHATHARTAAPFDDEFVARVEAKLGQFTQMGFDSAAARMVAETTRRLHRFGERQRVNVAAQHGDYGPQNVHLGKDHIYVFDLNYHVTAPVYEDIDYYLVTLETMNPYPRQPFFDRRRLSAMRDPFLSGYFGENAHTDERDVCLEGYYIKSLLWRCAKQRRNTAARGSLASMAFDALRLRGYYARRLAEQCRRVDLMLEALA